MDWYKKYLTDVAQSYGYGSYGGEKIGLREGDEVIIYDRRSVPVIQDLVEEITSEAIKVGGQWWHEFEYSYRRI